MRIGGYVAFAGDLDDFDPDGAAIALRKAGFDVMRMPATFRSRMEIPADDFLLVCTDGPETEKFIAVVMKEIDDIVRDYGGLLDDCGPIASDRPPFEELFSFRVLH
jgi:hypothetical protein